LVVSKTNKQKKQKTINQTNHHHHKFPSVCARDSGKARVDAAFGEVMTTCEKLWWLIDHGERALSPEKRPSGRMMFYKSARVEYVPLGVVGAIVPWNYPYHNVLNPLSAALFAGNGLVLKVSEHAAWSGAGFVKKVVDAALEAVGAPRDLVRIVAGFGDAGAALVSGGVDHLIFVGSTGVGRAVAAGAAPTLTPVTLELGGKDAFVVCADADLDAALAAGLRGAFQSCGQNCAGAERFIVHASVADEFAERAGAAARAMRQGNPLGGGGGVDSGSMCMPSAVAAVAALVDDAVAKGAKLLAGGTPKKTSSSSPGQFYPPTVLYGVRRGMRLWEEEVFGPVFAIAVARDDDDAVRLANDCSFGLGSAVFSRSQARARSIGARLEAGMTSLNDFATTYMCQSLPFGGVKESGYGRFAGVEGLRALTTAKAVAEDAAPLLIKTQIPPLLRYPVPEAGFGFVCGLIRMFYAPEWGTVAAGLMDVIGAAVFGAVKKGSSGGGGSGGSGSGVDAKKKPVTKKKK
jgi:acyl-CoA reductase-like NAD-dependent aldehyde dehydrogenase